MDLMIWLLVIGGAFLAAMIASSLIYRFSGVWQRMDASSPHATREKIELTQFAFFVLGERVVVGGYQSFFGFALGPILWLRRRDFGILSLTHQGFPDTIARLVQGQLMAKYKLKLSDDGVMLSGSFTPYKVEFSTDPAKIKSISPQPKVQRQYRRVETIVEKEIAIATPQSE